ncbi:hypothetical protein Pmani_021166 [Petrolisthes manimaculis]|uniref:Uncharacterized protein n=1 Tax=Petrolisthes manimaculis TaxID=1843537 RepID=A0AAE1PGX6_9EUCA|nr:hypothetical protein Pmani_021166 [Petrolisthes manimaculis]
MDNYQKQNNHPNHSGQHSAGGVSYARSGWKKKVTPSQSLPPNGRILKSTSPIPTEWEDGPKLCQMKSAPAVSGLAGWLADGLAG